MMIFNIIFLMLGMQDNSTTIIFYCYTILLWNMRTKDTEHLTAFQGVQLPF